jgi:hypothetical protein
LLTPGSPPIQLPVDRDIEGGVEPALMIARYHSHGYYIYTNWPLYDHRRISVSAGPRLRRLTYQSLLSPLRLMGTALTPARLSLAKADHFIHSLTHPTPCRISFLPTYPRVPDFVPKRFTCHLHTTAYVAKISSGPILACPSPGLPKVVGAAFVALDLLKCTVIRINLGMANS